MHFSRGFASLTLAQWTSHKIEIKKPFFMSPTFIFGSARAYEVTAKGNELAWKSSQGLNPCDACYHLSPNPDPGRSFICFLYFKTIVVLPSGLGMFITSVWQIIWMVYLSNGLTSAKSSKNMICENNPAPWASHKYLGILYLLIHLKNI